MTENTPPNDLAVRKDGSFEQLADLLPGTIFETNEKAIITNTNQTGLAAFGYDEADLHDGLSCLDMVIPEDRNRAAQNIESIAKGSETGREYTGLRKDGTTIPILIYMSPVHSNGNLSGFRGLIIDTSKFKQVQKKLAQSEEKYRLVVNNASEGLIVTGQGKFRFANPKACELLGYSLEELQGLDYFQFVHPDDKEIAKTAVKQRRGIKPGGQHHGFACRILSKTGEVVWLEFTGVPIVWEGKEAWLNFVVDITQRRVAQEEALLRAKLQAAVETAGATCHELNQPLQAVVLMADLMMTQMDRDDPLLPRMEKIRQQVRRMADITHRLNRITSYRVKDYIGMGNILDLTSTGPERDEEEAEEKSGKQAG